MPAIALVDPMVRDPAIVGASAVPMPRHPFMASASPDPVSAEPHIAGPRCWAIFLDTGWRRSSGDYGAHVIVARGWRCHDASAKRCCQHGNCYHPADTKVRTAHNVFPGAVARAIS